jgi:hypothetical protein
MDIRKGSVGAVLDRQPGPDTQLPVRVCHGVLTVERAGEHSYPYINMGIIIPDIIETSIAQYPKRIRK